MKQYCRAWANNLKCMITSGSVLSHYDINNYRDVKDRLQYVQSLRRDTTYAHKPPVDSEAEVPFFNGVS
jgi:hypothetical protein